MNYLLKPAAVTPRCDPGRSVGTAVKCCPCCAPSSLSPHPPDAGSAGSSGADRPTGTGRSLQNSERERSGMCVSRRRFLH